MKNNFYIRGRMIFLMVEWFVVEGATLSEVSNHSLDLHETTYGGSLLKQVQQIFVC